MQRIISILILVACLVFWSSAPVKAGFFEELFDTETLVVIDGKKYTKDDFKRWWGFWREGDTPLPKTPEPYINWLLLGQEGARMDLAQDPAFQHQTRVFLQARGLMMLKREAVDTQVAVPEEDIKKRYEELYLPRWQVQRLKFKDEETAMAAWKEVSDGAVTLEELLERDVEQGGPEKTHESWARPETIDKGWVEIFREMEPGQIVDPEKHNKGMILFVLKETKGFEEEDYAMFHERIEKDLSKMRANALTFELLGKLRQKYQVRIDEERLAALDIHAPDETFTDEPIITSTEENVSEKEFIAIIRKVMAARPTIAHAAMKPEEVENVKWDTVNNVIGQSVTNWEAVNRGYEKQEPFKWEYDFNYHHRLGVALEKRLFATKAEVSDEEIEAFYQANLARFTQPSTIKLYIVDETQAPVEKIWTDVTVGEKFKKVAEESYNLRLVPQEVPANHLDPEIKAVADKLRDGETSQVFSAQGVNVIIHVVKKTPESVLPKERVAESIRAQLQREKHQQARAEYLNTLKSQIEIDVRNRPWKNIQKELGGA